MNKLLMDAKDVAAVVIDDQTRLVPVMEGAETLIAATARLLRGLRVLHIPVLVTQQYTKGLGPTVPELSEILGAFSPIEKNTFSAMKNEKFVRRLNETGKRTVLLAGIETHICVEQTALQLIEQGYRVFLAADCCSSRKPVDREQALARLVHSGATLTTGEAALFELMDGSKSDGFKQISAIVK